MTDNDEIRSPQWYNDVATVKRMFESGGALCLACCTPFDNAKHRRLIDSCGHEICYMCINSDHCPLCIYNGSRLHSGSRQPDTRPSRPRMKTNGHFTPYMQARDGSITSPDRITALPPKSSSFYHTRGHSQSSPTRAQRGLRRTKWPNPLGTDSQAYLSDDESRWSNNRDLLTRLGLLFADHDTPVCGKGRTTSQVKGCGSNDASYASISSLASSDATNTSPLSTLTDSSEMRAPSSNVSSFRSPCRDESSDSIVSLMSTSNSHSSSDSPRGTIFQRNGPMRSSDSFIQINRRCMVPRSNVSEDSALHLPEIARKGHVNKILARTLKPLNFEVAQSEVDPLFVGRHWLFKDIQQEFAVDGKGKKVVLIVGGPGSGKTAVVSQLVEHSFLKSRREDAIYQDIQSLDGSDYAMSNSSSSDSGMYQSIGPLHAGTVRSLSNHLVAYHLCQADNSATCLVPEFVHSIASHLCQAPQLTAYSDLVARDHRIQEYLSMVSCISDSSEAFVHGVLEPLGSLRRQGKIPNANCIIVVDGLNEAEFHRPDYGDTIASFLAKHIHLFPPWLKLVATIRTGYNEILKSLPAHIVSLDKSSSHEDLQKDIASYILQRINCSPAIRSNITINNNKVEGSTNSRFASHLANLSKGCMLYVKLTLDLIEKGYLVIKSSSYRVLPVSLSEVYMLNFNLKFTTSKSYEKVSPLLQVCLASLYPLSLQELHNTVNSNYLHAAITWEDFMQRLDTLMSGPFLVTRQDGTVVFSHPSLREWLRKREENESTKFLCDIRAGHAAIALQMSRSNRDLNAEEILELGHHVLKAHIYRSINKDQLLPFHPRDLQAHWVHLSSKAIASALSCPRNLYSPNVKVSRLLLLSGASPHVLLRSIGNTTLLSLASYLGFVEMVSLFAEFGADLECVSDAGFSALAYACQQGHLDIVRLLLAKGAKINQVDNEGNCPVVHAASNGHLEVVAHLVRSDWPIDNSDGPLLHQAAQRAFVAAASKGHARICEILLDLPEVRINAIDHFSGHTGLTAACAAGQLNVCESLLRRGAHVSTTNYHKESPLICASVDGQWEIAEMLLLRGAALEMADGMGQTPLIKASIGGHPVLELLLSKGANSETADNEGMTALCWAALKGHCQAIQCLLRNGADPNHADRNGRTALDFAAYGGSPESVNMLLDAGAVLEHIDASGMRPLDRAIACQNISVVVYFLHKGAKLGSQTWIVADGKPEILLLLLTKLLEDATLLYKKMRLKDALHRYQYALKKFPGDFSIEADRRFKQLKFQLLVGLSRCRRKMNEPLQAVQAADQAIVVKPKSYEGYYARARAHEELRNHRCGLSDVTEALRLAPQNMEIQKLLLRLKDKISASDHKVSHEKFNNGISHRISEGNESLLGSTETIDQLCNLTLDIVADLEQLNDKLQDSGCESNQ